MKRNICLLVLVALSVPAFSQCDISNRIAPGGAMYYYLEPVVFYYTKDKALKGGIITDKENYFLTMLPTPFPQKPAGRKLSGDLELKLANNKIYSLKHFDTQYMNDDSIMQLLYLIDKKDIADFMNFEAIQAKIDMKGTEGERTYVFKLHKKAIQEQLGCFLKEEEKKK
jgi:hypothetical protein